MPVQNGLFGGLTVRADKFGQGFEKLYIFVH